MQTNGINTSPYQFYPTMNQGYNAYGQMQSPYVPAPTYQPSLTNPTSQQSNQNRSQGILGRMISNPKEITPQEIPMDGSISLFPMQDGSAVYGKFWDSNGQINTIRFVPDNIADADPEPDPFDKINKRFDELEKMIKSQRQYHKPYRKNNSQTNQNGSTQSESGDLNA